MASNEVLRHWLTYVLALAGAVLGFILSQGVDMTRTSLADQQAGLEAVKIRMTALELQDARSQVQYGAICTTLNELRSGQAAMTVALAQLRDAVLVHISKTATAYSGDPKLP